jgi:hypothetical protein
MEHNKPDFTLLEYITKKLKLIESKEACSTLAEEIYELESKI